MARTPLDLRGKTITELMELNYQNAIEINAINFASRKGDDIRFKQLLADRREIRIELELRDPPPHVREIDFPSQRPELFDCHPEDDDSTYDPYLKY